MYSNELRVAIDAGLLARKAILQVYEQDFDVEIKSDQSPVTEADKRADTIIKEYIKERFPTHSFLTEESEDDASRLQNDYVWIVDPVDGTKDFVARNGEFTTNIALAYRHEIVVGVVIVPVSGDVYFATKDGGAFHLIHSRITRLEVSQKLDDLTMLTSRFHLKDEEIDKFKKYKDRIVRMETYGSSLKACRIASGLAEVSYRLSNGTKEWDTAASQIIVEEAGGVFVKPDGTRYTYNREDVYNREGYIIANRKENVLL